MKMKMSVLVTGLAIISLSIVPLSCSSKKSDENVKQLLQKALAAVERMEGENASLKAKTERSNIDKITTENKELKKELAALKKEKGAIEAKASKFEGQAAHRQLQLESAGDSGNRIGILEKDNKSLKDEISKLKGLLSFTRLQLESKEDQSSRIAQMEQTVAALQKKNGALEKKKQELTDLLKRINALVKTQPAPAAPAK